MDQEQISILQMQIIFHLKLNEKVHYLSQLYMTHHLVLLKLEFLNFQFKIFKLMIVGMVFSQKVVNLILSDSRKENLYILH